MGHGRVDDAMSEALRDTDLNVTSYRRLVVRELVSALRSVYDANYNRERQLKDLKITTHYPLVKLDYPSIVIEYTGQRVMNAGVGHEEWFVDDNGILRKWNHRRFEGTLNFSCHALSPLDIDILTDSIIEVLSFGRLDAQLGKFFTNIYGNKTDPVMLIFSQLMLNVDDIIDSGVSAQIAPWQPEDVLVYSSDVSIVTHGGFYNTYPQDEWYYVTSVQTEPYPQGFVNVELPFGESEDEKWSNPFEYEDDNATPSPTNEFDRPNWLAGRGVVSGVEHYSDAEPFMVVTGVGQPSGVDELNGQTVGVQGAPSAADF